VLPNLRQRNSGDWRWASVTGCVLAMLCVVPQAVRAQDDTPDQERREAAAAAYDRGSKAYIARDFELAARFYETAFRLAPAAPALIQAVRAHQQAGDDRRAGTVALALQEEYGVEQMAEHTKQALEQARTKYFRIDVVCENCQLEVEGNREAFLSVFLEPDKEHSVTAVFESGKRTKQIEGAAGAQKVLTFVAPGQEEEPEKAVAATTATAKAKDASSTHDADDLEEESTSSKGLSPVFFWTGVGLTAVAAGVTVWSGLDTQSAADDYKKNPTQEGLDDGQSLEMRTNVLIGVTAALAVGTGVVGIFFTDWGGSSEKQPNQSASARPRFNLAATVLPGGAMATVRGQF
jgi:hypothetical protein